MSHMANCLIFLSRCYYFQANEDTKDLEKYYIEDAIGSTFFSKSWLLSTLSNLDETSEEDLESISEMSCDDQVKPRKYKGNARRA